MVQKKRGGGCGRSLGCGCLLLVVLLLAVGVGGYLAYRSGAITLTQVLTVVGLGPGDIEVDNFRDDTVYVTITQLNVAAGETPASATLEVAPFDIQTYRAEKTGRYSVGLSTTSGGTNLGTCTLNIRSGDVFQFVPLPDKTVVNRANKPSSLGSDYVIETCSFCR
jgi:hypothetical protein